MNPKLLFCKDARLHQRSFLCVYISGDARLHQRTTYPQSK